MLHKIKVKRDTSKGTGVLAYSGLGNVSTTCWFEIFDPIKAGTYSGCSATQMNTKKNSKGGKREGIYLPDAQTERRGIFIHMGTNSAWSNGCIVIAEHELLKIWNSIVQKDAPNVTVIIED